MKNKFLCNSVYFSTIFISLSCIYTLIYYNYFNIDIFLYINIQEAVLQLLNNSYLFLVFIISIPIYIFITNSIGRYNTANPSIKKPRSYYFKVILVFILALLGTVFILKYYFNTWSFPILFIIFWMVYLLLTYNSKLFDFFYAKFRIEKEHYTFIFFFILLFICVLGNCFFHIIENTESNIKSGTIIYTNDSTITVKDRLIYVGKSEKYIFLHNFKDGSNTIIPVNEIKLIKDLKHVR